MVWFRVDDTVAFHPKVIQAGNTAMGLWVRAGAWSAAHLTDGFIPTRIALQIGTKKSCDRLVIAGLFEEEDGGYRFHEWDAKNFTKLQVEAKREQSRKTSSDHRKRRLAVVQPANESNGVAEDVTDNVIHRASDSVTDQSVIAPLPYPSLPSCRDLGGNSPVGSDATPDATPPQFCLDHPDGTAKPCRACAGYRKHYERWLAEQDTKTRHATQTQTRQNTISRLDAIENCTLCDEDGYRNYRVCDHIDHSPAHRNGMPQIRAALQKKPQPL